MGKLLVRSFKLYPANAAAEHGAALTRWGDELVADVVAMLAPAPKPTGEDWAPGQDLRLGHRGALGTPLGDAVAAVQRIVGAKADGWWGTLDTDTKVRAWQRAHALPERSVWGEAERRAAAATPPERRARGIDVSHHQGAVDFAAIRASGISFAICRTGDGLMQDRRFAEHWAGIKGAGLVRGAYHFWRPGTVAYSLQQADLVVAAVGRLGDGDMPVAMDVECPPVPPGMDQAAWVKAWVASVSTAALVAFVQRVAEGTGKVPLVYAGMGSWHWGDVLAALGCEQWIADWGWKDRAKRTPLREPPLSPGFRSWRLFQWTDRIAVPGEPQGVDADVYNGTEEALRAWAAGPERPAGCALPGP